MDGGTGAGREGVREAGLLYAMAVVRYGRRGKRMERERSSSQVNDVLAMLGDVLCVVVPLIRHTPSRSFSAGWMDRKDPI